MSPSERFVGAQEFFPARITLSTLKDAAGGCRGCPLYRDATQTVFGEGPRTARVVLVGEQPGNDEDLRGAPFVGPAGRVLDQALAAAGIERADAYLTNVVKHFKWVAKGDKRIHKTPRVGEISACLPWLEQELAVLEPEVLVALGATAAQALFGRDFRVTSSRGELVETPLAPRAFATVHPSSILRQPTSEDRKRAMAGFVEDLRLVAKLLAQSA